MELQPSNDVHAEVDFLEFHNTKGTLPKGTYKVVEADGDTSYAVLGDFRGDIKWFTEAEYESAIQEQMFNQRQDDALDDIMRSGDDFDDDDREELMDSWDDAMHRDHDEQRRFDSRAEDSNITDTEFNQYVDDTYKCNEAASVAFDERMAKPVKTLGELLRESMLASPLATESGGYEIATHEDQAAFAAKRNASLRLRGFNV
jgi:hypothetical protein